MITVNVKALRGAMKDMTRVIEAKNTVPICSTVLVSSTPGAMVLNGTDLEMWIEQHVDLEEAGKNTAMSFCVDARTLEKIAGKLPADGNAVLEADGNSGIIVKCGRSRFKLPTLDADDFPRMPVDGWDAQFEMEATNLVAMIDSVRHAISTEETRYYLNGIFVHVLRGERMFAAATDGNQLARFDCEPADGAADMPDIILPRKLVGVLDDLLADHAGKVDLSISTGKIRVDLGQTVLISKLIDGTFPDYTRVIPAANDKVIWFEPKALAEAVDRVAVVSTDKQRSIKLTATQDLISLQVVSLEKGIATEDVPCHYDGDEIEIGFNARFLLDLLKQLSVAEGAQAQVLLSDAAGPALWRDSDQSQRLYVLMPMRVG